MPRKDLIKDVRKIVIKIGTSTITENDILSRERIRLIVSDIVLLLKAGFSVVIVTSGAITAGAGALRLNRLNASIPKKQAFAAVGQSILMNEYRLCFSNEGYEVGQILLTEDDVKNRRRFINARHTIDTLLEMGIIPIVNENDSVVIKEIKFGDNDILSAYVANIAEADLLILLSDINGFYRCLSDDQPIDEIDMITDEIVKCAGGTGSVHGTGGMLSKLKAAEVIIRSGEMMIIANGMIRGVLSKIIKGEKIGTLFIGRDKALSSRKRWIAFNMKAMGTIIIDKGAENAIAKEKKSLLSIGITDVKGNFDLGDAVEIINADGNRVGKGIVNYNKNELKKIKGKRTDQIKEILGTSYYDEVINRDDLIVY